jgi:aryl-alcohol dehydrogenase-like predicted oxidoreductase
MDYTLLGKTGLRVSVMGLGCGGHSRLGLSQGHDHAVAIVSRALELGINLIDTAEGYGTERAVGDAIKGVKREDVVISTKVGSANDGNPLTGNQFQERVNGCLARLEVDYVDILHVHGVPPDLYPHTRDVLLPALHELRDAGKIRFAAISEVFARDTGHAMLQSALDDAWDIMMVGFNILNQSARDRVLKRTQALGVGTLDMFAVRKALSRPEELRKVVTALKSQGLLDEGVDTEAPLGFLLEDGVAASIPEAAYRFCRYEPGIDVVLSGTGNIDHLEQNVRSLLMPPLPLWAVERLHTMFDAVDNVSGN